MNRSRPIVMRSRARMGVLFFACVLRRVFQLPLALYLSVRSNATVTGKQRLGCSRFALRLDSTLSTCSCAQALCEAQCSRQEAPALDKTGPKPSF